MASIKDITLGATLHPWSSTPYWLLKNFKKRIFNNQYDVVPQGCNVAAPHF